MAAPDPVKLAIVGGPRGAAYLPLIDALAGRVELAAACARSEATQAEWRRRRPGVKIFDSLERLLDFDGCAAVLLATPMPLHAAQAVQALRAGRHVLAEVAAATTVEACWELVETAAASGRVYMMAENYCYARACLRVLNLARQGCLGELRYAEGGYIHDTRHLARDPQGRLTWRGELRKLRGNTYPTHSLGPVAQWLDAVHGGSDRLATVACWVAAAGDPVSTLIRTERGAVILLRRDSSSPRPHQMFHFELQGSRGAFVSGRHEGEDGLVWIDGRSAGSSPGEASWDKLEDHAAEFEHPRWRRWGGQASRSGHGGGDFLVLEEFLSAIEEGRRPGVDAVDAATWSSIIPLSIESAARGGAPIAIPDFACASR